MSLTPLSTFRTGAALAVLALLLQVPLHAAGTAPDLDGDGIPNIVDPDIDNDGIPNALDDNIDGGWARSGPFAGKYLGDHLDNANPAEKDIDGDELSDGSLAERDIDGDGKADDASSELDIDGDGREDDAAAERDIDGDGRNDDMLDEDDIDGDGYDDDDAAEMDTDGDGLNNGDLAENDHDGDGITDDLDDDRDGDGRPDMEDDDDNNDGISDNDDGSPDLPGEQKLTNQLIRNAAAPSNADARAQIHLRSSGSARFGVKVENFGPGSYAVLVGSVPRGTITIGSGDSDGELAFDTHPDDPGELLLDFNPAGLTVSILSGSTEWFHGSAPTPSAGGTDQSWESEFARSAAAAPKAEGRIKLSVSASGSASLTVEIQDLAPGTYDVRVGGIIRGQLVAAVHSNRVEGSLKFIANPDQSGEALLNFDAAHQPITVEKSGTVHLTGTSPGPPAGP
jgi:hypothetical protein